MSYNLKTKFFAVTFLLALTTLSSLGAGVTVRDMVMNGQAKFAIVSKKVSQTISEAQVVLTGTDGKPVLNYGSPYLKNEYAAPLWADFISGSLGIPCSPDQIEVTEDRADEASTFAVAFALDHSPSMTQPRAVRMQRAIQQAISTFDPRDYVSVIKFTGRVNVEVELTNNRDSYLSGFRVNGLNMRSDGTALIDAARQSLNQLGTTKATTKRILVLFTDGEDNASSSNIDEVITMAKEMNATIHAVSYGVTDETTLQRMANETGGRLYRLQDVFDFDKIFQGIYSSLRCTYNVRINCKRHVVVDTLLGAPAISRNASANTPIRSSDFMSLMPKQGINVLPETTLPNAVVLSAEVRFLGDTDVELDDLDMLDSVATVLIQRSDLALEVMHGLSSPQESTPEQVMSYQRKAQLIREVLIRRGVAPSRVHGYGGVNPGYFGEVGAKTRKTMFVFTRL